MKKNLFLLSCAFLCNNAVLNSMDLIDEIETKFEKIPIKGSETYNQKKVLTYLKVEKCLKTCLNCTDSCLCSCAHCVKSGVQCACCWVPPCLACLRCTSSCLMSTALKIPILTCWFRLFSR